VPRSPARRVRDEHHDDSRRADRQLPGAFPRRAPVENFSHPRPKLPGTVRFLQELDAGVEDAVATMPAKKPSVASQPAEEDPKLRARLAVAFGMISMNTRTT